MPAIDLSILNQRQTPAFYADVFANRPAAGFVGRIFVSTNTFAFYRDNGTGWDLIGGPGTGTITGSGTAGTVPLWNGASTIGDSTLIEGGTKFTTTKDIQADAFYLNGMTAGSGALYWTSDRVTLANYNPTGTVEIEVAGGAAAQTINADLSTRFYGNIIRNGGTSSQFLKADGSLDSNTYNTGSGVAGQVAFFSGTNAITGNNDLFWDNVNGHLGVGTITPGTALDVKHDQSTVVQLEQITATNDIRIAFINSGVGLWRLGAFYNAGANDFGLFDIAAAAQPVTVKRTTGQVLIGTSTVGSGKLVVASATSDNGIQIVGANAPSLRIDNAESGPTKRAGFGISTATNNFIQGSADRDFCIFNGSTTASPMLFGIYDTTNVQEAARISAARNFIIGSSVDAGYKLDVNGTGRFTGALNTTGGTRQLQMVSFAGDINYLKSTGANFQTGTSDANSYFIQTNNVDRLTISSTGITTLSGTNQEVLGITGNSASGTVLRLSNTTTGGGDFRIFSSGSGNGEGAGKLLLTFNGAVPILTIGGSTGNLLIGSTTDDGNKLQVNGSGVFSGDIKGTVDLYLLRSGVAPAIVLSQQQVRFVDQSTGFSQSININSDNLQFSGGIRTAAPSGGSQQTWKLGNYTAGAAVQGGKVRVEINGVAYDLLTA
jgi:hypothetical protein